MNRMQRTTTKYLLAILATGLILLSACRADVPAESGQSITVPLLGYCTADQYKPCIVSFSTDAWDNMLISLLLPDRSFPPFHLLVVRGESEISYACQRLTGVANNAYCAGPKLPPGESVTLKLLSNDDDTLLAQGDLAIIGLAFPTLEVAIATSQEAPTAFAVEFLPPTVPAVEFPPPTVPAVETLTPTFITFEGVPPSTDVSPTVPPSFENPSYPNPSYP